MQTTVKCATYTAEFLFTATAAEFRAAGCRIPVPEAHRAAFLYRGRGEVRVTRGRSTAVVGAIGMRPPFQNVDAVKFSLNPGVDDAELVTVEVRACPDTVRALNLASTP